RHLLAVRLDDLADLSTRELLAPLSGASFAEEVLGFLWLLAEAMRCLLFLQALEAGALDRAVELFGRRRQKQEPRQLAESLLWLGQHVFVAHDVDGAVR